MKSVNKFLLVISLFVALFTICDKVIGFSLDIIMDKLPNSGNEVSHVYYSINKTSEPIIIVGSSRARHHYDPKIISDSLGLPAYNTGLDGNFLTYQCALINAIIDRYTPNLIIWEMGANSLYEEDIDPTESLHPYYRNPKIKMIVDEKEGSYTKFKMWFDTYRYNGTALSAFTRLIQNNKPQESLNGFVIRNKVIDNIAPPITKPLKGKLSNNKTNLFRETLSLIKEKGIKCILVDSPLYERQDTSVDNKSMIAIQTLCESYGFKYYDYRYIFSKESNYTMFCDHNHLNTEGARRYTSIITPLLKQYCP